MENGVYWYRHFNAFGFADTGEVWLNDCDVAYPKSAKRVSWFVDQNIGPTYTLNPSLNPSLPVPVLDSDRHESVLPEEKTRIYGLGFGGIRV